MNLRDSKIFLAGHRGMVGSAILRNLTSRGCQNIFTQSRHELDLKDAAAVRSYFQRESFDVVFLAAAKVGGIHANNTYRADFIYQNLQIQNNVIWSAHETDVKRLVFLGSSCIYPRNIAQPMKEEDLLTASLEPTNRPYALAKIAGLELVNSLRRQYHRDYFSVMPTNQYGPGDNFHPEDSHVFASLIRKFCLAVRENSGEVSIWGTGKPLREFMHADDCADAIVFLTEMLTFDDIENSPLGRAGWSHINVGSGEEISILTLAQAIAKEAGFSGKLTFDSNKPDGIPRKLLDCSYLRGLGWKPKITLQEGIPQMIKMFRELNIS